jgi:catechol 2,3-dioxygenase-like lactoylglutathione lyase family enzyme
MVDQLSPSEALMPCAPEFFVPEMDAALRFYVDGLGFQVLRREPVFAVVALGDAHVLIAHDSIAGPQLASGPRGNGLNVRIMVDDVDLLRERAGALRAPIVHEIADRPYGLRDFIVADPNGFLLRFASPISS